MFFMFLFSRSQLNDSTKEREKNVTHLFLAQHNEVWGNSYECPMMECKKA
jgi:hypothetical protein